MRKVAFRSYVPTATAAQTQRAYMREMTKTGDFKNVRVLVIFIFIDYRYRSLFTIRMKIIFLIYFWKIAFYLITRVHRTSNCCLFTTLIISLLLCLTLLKRIRQTLSTINVILFSRAFCVFEKDFKIILNYTNVIDIFFQSKSNIF